MCERSFCDTFSGLLARSNKIYATLLVLAVVVAVEEGPGTFVVVVTPIDTSGGK